MPNYDWQVFELDAQQSKPLELTLHARDGPVIADAFVFIDDSQDRSEECLAIRATLMPALREYSAGFGYRLCEGRTTKRLAK